MIFPIEQLQSLAGPKKGSIVSGPFGSNISARFFVNEGVPVIRGNNLTIGGEKFVDEGFAFLTEEKASEFKNCEAVKDDIILTAAGSIGQVGIIPAEAKFPRYIISNKQLRVRLDESKANPMFVYYWLSSPNMTDYIIGQNNGGAIPLLNLGIIRKLPVPNPGLKVQDKVVQVLEGYDNLIATNQRRIALLEEAARRLYREWFVHLRFPGHETVRVVDCVPVEWNKQALSSVADVNARSIGSREKPDSILYIDISSVSPGCVNAVTPYAFEDAPGRARRRVLHGDVIWSCVRPNRRSYALIWDPDEDLVASTGFAVLSVTGVPFSYLYFATTTDEFVGYLEQNATGAAYPAVTAKVFEDAEILVPDSETLVAFDAFVLPQLEQMEALKMQNKALARARDALLPKLMSGQLDVSNIRADYATEAA